MLTADESAILARAKALWAEREQAFPAFVRQRWEQGTVEARLATIRLAERETGIDLAQERQ